MMNQVIEPESQEQKPPLVVKPKRRIDVKKVFHGPWPWLMLIIPVTVFGTYLVMHPEAILSAMNNPFSIAFIFSIPIALFAIKLVLDFFSTIEKWVRLQLDKAKESKRGHFFEAVTMVFMFVSVMEGGPFFNRVQGDILYGFLGYLTVFAFDLIAVVCINARRKELARGGRSGIYLTGILLCAGVSIVANSFSAFSNFHHVVDPNFPPFLSTISPYVGIVFPVMIVFLAFSKDTEVLVDDAETYRKKHQKQVDYLKARKEMDGAIKHELQEIDLLKKRDFFLKNWLFTAKKVHYIIDVVFEKMQGKLDEHTKILHDDLDQKAKLISTQVQTINAQWEEMQRVATTIEDTYGKQLAQALDQNRSMRKALGEITLSLSDLGRKMEAIERQKGEPFDAIGLYINDAIQVALEQFEDSISTSISASATSPSEERKKQKGSVFSEEEIASMSAYPFFVSALRTGRQSLTSSEIGNMCNLSPQMVAARIKNKDFLPTRREGYYSISSIGKWLKGYRPTSKRSEVAREDQGIEQGQDTDQVASIGSTIGSNGNGHRNDTTKLADLDMMEV
jgi:hypothetical protein